jgi:formylglycine-generating enzyme required for sulfatase activity
MGGLDGDADERPLTRVKIDQPFWTGKIEVTNRQFNRFDPTHDNGYFDQHHKDHNTPGYPAQGPNEPVIRVSWDQAMAFCQWLTAKTGRRFTLPTEAQWEWACRAGTATPFFYGDLDTDFSPFANLADLSIRLLAVAGVNPQPIANPNPYEDFIPKDGRFNDKAMVMTDAGTYQPNPWGLYDMHGNVAEWTISTYRPYPSEGGKRGKGEEGNGTNASSPFPLFPFSPFPEKVVRGASWRDRPYRARSAFRLAYEPWQQIYNVGFRVICPVQ